MFLLLLQLVELIVATDHDSDRNVVLWHILVWMSDKAKYGVFAVVSANCLAQLLKWYLLQNGLFPGEKLKEWFTTTKLDGLRRFDTKFDNNKIWAR